MRRLQLFEWEDQPWLPSAFRRYLGELLQRQTSEIYRPVLPVMARWLRDCGFREVIDLGSGAGGPWPALAAALAGGGIAVTVTLTDRFPPAFASSSAGAEGYHPEPVEATEIPASLSGCLTLFTCFHHFEPPRARALLRQAAESRTPIAVYEFTERRWSRLLGMLPSPLLVWAQTPALAPFRWSRIFWTYAVPVVPLLYLWDGAVSHLRSYTPAELRAMTVDIVAPGYRWELGRLENPEQGVTITYLLGFAERGERLVRDASGVAQTSTANRTP